MASWLISVCASALAIMFLQNIVSSNSTGLKKTARFALGLVFIIVLISPLKALIGKV